MKSILSLAALLASTSAHYTFPTMTYNGVTGSPWANVRQWSGYVTNAPVTDVTSNAIQCNVNASSPVAGSSGILAVTAGSTFAMNAAQPIYHPGPGLVYLAKVPTGSTAATWTPSGKVWFKIAEYGPTSYSPLTWTTDNAASIKFTLPKSLPNGDYLVRVEQIGLHVASTKNGAQFYLSCGQLRVTGGGSGTPTPLVAFPGAYTPTDPSLLINIYNPAPTSYTMPGPKVWSG